MVDANAVIVALKKEFPVPEIDPQWVNECMQALIDDGQNASLHAVREQYLFSDLAQSTTPSASAIPPNAHKIRLFPRPTLLQIISMTEIGSSAFQLQTVAEQRKDIINGTTLIRRMDDEMDEEDEEAIKEGKMPVYPRGMLKFELTMGDGVVVDAIEYKKVAGILLGETSLGAKLRVKNVKVLRGVLMLDPSNTEFLGYQVDDLEAEQPTRFLDSLAQRLNKPVSNHPRPVARARAQPSAPAVSSRQITATTRPRNTQTRLSFSPEKSEIEIVDDNIPFAGPSTSSNRMSPPLSARRPTRAASTAASARVTNIYSQSAQVDQVFAAAAPDRSRGRDSASIQSIDDDESMDFDDSFLQQIDAVEARAGRPDTNFIDDDEEEDQYDFDDDDESFIRQIDEVEKAATRNAEGERKTSRFFDQPTDPNGVKNGGSKRKPVYVVDSDGDSEKENCEPDIVYISD